MTKCKKCNHDCHCSGVCGSPKIIFDEGGPPQNSQKSRENSPLCKSRGTGGHPRRKEFRNTRARLLAKQPASVKFLPVRGQVFDASDSQLVLTIAVLEPR